MVQLVAPSIKYRSSFITALKEQQPFYGYLTRLPHFKTLSRQQYIHYITHHFDQFLESIEAFASIPQIENIFTTRNIYWSVDNQEYLGRLTIRHQLINTPTQLVGHLGIDIRPTKRGQGYGKQTLFQGIKMASQLGINPLIATCALDNIASIKTLESLGGILTKKYSKPTHKPKLCYLLPTHQA